MMKTFRLLLGFIIIFPMICPAQKKELLITITLRLLISRNAWIKISSSLTLCYKIIKTKTNEK